MWLNLWGIPAIGTLIFLWGYLIVGSRDEEIKKTYTQHGGLISMMLFCVVLAAIWFYTIPNMMKFISKHEKENEEKNV
jgi:uncharacterized membrane protein YdjX (TVP38/TMEM64 family)